MATTDLVFQNVVAWFSDSQPSLIHLVSVKECNILYVVHVPMLSLSFSLSATYSVSDPRHIVITALL